MYKDPETGDEFDKHELDLSEEFAKSFGEQLREEWVLFTGKWIRSAAVEEIEIRRTPYRTTAYLSHLTPEDIFGKPTYSDVTRQFVKSPPKKEEISKKRKETRQQLSKNIFIVHGRDHQPMKELKEMLYDFGLNPVVLHEKESEGSLTLAEKLEEYSEDVGYAFAILTPDDIGCEETEFERVKSKAIAQVQDKPRLISAETLGKIFGIFNPRARQNVIFEMGYFWGLLKRKRVCCFLKGDVEKPSDIKGVVYIPFKDSIRSVEVKIMKKLTKAGYEVRM